MQGVKDEAVAVYADSLTTRQMLYDRVSQRVNNTAVFLIFWISLEVHSKNRSRRPQRKAVVAF
ncbi:MAG: hypothetical protein JRF37_06335 [Deltaproteobacteria bacterium]|nr:hypothetical protein [Deltaproteobacteria bacterium]